MGLHFACTQCGRCCHDLRLSLSMAEAVAWLDDGGTVQLLCDAAPATEDPELAAVDRRARSFEARSGTLPILVAVTLVAWFEGACPNLLPDMRCAIYARRPATCRIYPAEMRHSDLLDPATKRCPPEAWTPDQPLFAASGRVRDGEVSQAITSMRRHAIGEASARAALCRILGVHAAAFANEGLFVGQPSSSDLRAALSRTQTGDPGPPSEDWVIVSNRRSTRDLIADAGALAADADEFSRKSYLGYFPSS